MTGGAFFQNYKVISSLQAGIVCVFVIFLFTDVLNKLRFCISLEAAKFLVRVSVPTLFKFYNLITGA